MNFINKKVLLALAFLSISGSAFGYTWTFTNVTTKALVIELKLFGWPSRYFSIVRPGENTSMEWGFGNPRWGHCLDYIKVAELSKNILGEKMYTDVIENAANAPDHLLGRHPLQAIDIEWVPEGNAWNSFNTESLNAAKELGTMAHSAYKAVGGEATLNSLLAKASALTGGKAKVETKETPQGLVSMLNFDTMLQGLGTMSTLSSSFANLLKKSKCASRDFTIVESADKGLTLVTKE